MLQVTHFILVPDSGAARRLRRELVEGAARSGYIVGVWNELLEYAKSVYLAPAREGDWDALFHACLEDMPTAFWAESYQLAAQETAAGVEAALCNVITALEPGSDFDISGMNELPVRLQKILKDVLQLATNLKGALPDHLSTMKELVAADVGGAFQSVLVYSDAEAPALNRWQALLVEKLNRDAGVSCDKDIEAILQRLFSGTGQIDSSSNLAQLQVGLYESSAQKYAVDESLQWVGVRDFLEEAEVAAGMVQTMLAENADLKPSDIGLLLPDSFEYALATDDAFSLAGLALSGLPSEHWKRDLGREALFHFLYCQQKPAPAMALAVCLASPLMPWPREEGAKLAQDVMDGDYRLKPFYRASKEARSMLDLIRGDAEKPETLIEVLQVFVSLLDEGEAFSGHVQQAKTTMQSLCTMLGNMQDIDWAALRLTANPQTITTGGTSNFNLEGVTVWREGQEPWRPVRFLIVLGFSRGHYPAPAASSVVFSADDLKLIKEHVGLSLLTPQDESRHKRARFKRQLAAVSEFISFLIPQMDSSGAPQSPSESLVFMRELLDIPKDDSPILTLDAEIDRAHIRFLAQSVDQTPIPPRDLISDDIKFGSNLLALRKDKDGNIKPESPSSLEALMVSRLAWMLRRLDAEPLGWAPETPNVMLLGTLAHEAFEHLFAKGRATPEKAEIAKRLEGIMDDAIAQHAPFMTSPQWKVERQTLIAGTTRAAEAWSDILHSLSAEVLGCEEWLQGKLKDVAIHGQVDVLLGLPNNRLLVVDYKRSSSSSRRPRMEKGYDSQANLYRTMLQTGGPKDTEHGEIASRFQNASQTGVVYYMLNDQIALSDTLLAESAKTPGWDSLQENVSANAMKLIEKCLIEVKAGSLRLNREGDEEFFEKQAGVKPYALANSPLISLFMLPGEAEEAQ